MIQDCRARLDVETHGRLVEQKQTRSVQKGARNLHPPHLAARKLRDAIRQAIGEIDAREGRSERVSASRRPMPCSAAWYKGSAAPNVDVQRARLENDAELAERRARLPRDVMAVNRNAALPRRIKASDQCEQCRFASAIQTQEEGERTRCDGEADRLERASRAIAMTYPSKVERGVGPAMLIARFRFSETLDDGAANHSQTAVLRAICTAS